MKCCNFPPIDRIRIASQGTILDAMLVSLQPFVGFSTTSGRFSEVLYSLLSGGDTFLNTFFLYV
jgi:hypothetical protein